MKKVSIIIAMYNGEETIERAISSLINQTYENIEVIVIDDGSQDNSYDVVKSIFSNSSIESILIKNEKNSGLSYSRNRGMDNATGDYYLFVDADDVVAPQFVEHLVKAVEEDKYGFAFSNMIECSRYDDAKMIYNDYESKKTSYNYISDIVKIHGYACGSLYSADIINKNNLSFCEECRFLEDNLFNFEYLRYIESAYYVSSSIYYYMKVSGSLTHPKDKIIIINNFKTAEMLFEKYSVLERVLSNENECVEYIANRRYLRNCYFGEISSSKYTFKVPDQKKYYKNSQYLKIIKKSNMSFMKKFQEILMLNPFIEKLIYKVFL